MMVMALVAFVFLVNLIVLLYLSIGRFILWYKIKKTKKAIKLLANK